MTSETGGGKKKVALLAMGGTIASSGSGGAGVTPNLDAAAIVAGIPQLEGVAELTGRSLRTVPSAEIGIADLAGVVAAAKEELRAGAVGVVVTQGTNMLEEAAFVLDALWDDDAPLVLTGAMRNPTLPGPDGPANLVAAAVVAASGEARGLGAVVVFNNEVHAARFVRKTHTTSLATFQSPGYGPLGWVSEGRCRIALRPSMRFGILSDHPGSSGPVAIVQAVLGEDDRLLRSLRGLGYQGLVVEASGPGHVSSSWAGALRELATTMPVVLASRTGSGELLRETYDFEGSEIDLLGAGLVGAGWLDARKARLFLLLLLSTGADMPAIREAFDQLGSFAGSFVIGDTEGTP